MRNHVLLKRKGKNMGIIFNYGWGEEDDIEQMGNAVEVIVNRFPTCEEAELDDEQIEEFKEAFRLFLKEHFKADDAVVSDLSGDPNSSSVLRGPWALR